MDCCVPFGKVKAVKVVLGGASTVVLSWRMAVLGELCFGSRGEVCCGMVCFVAHGFGKPVMEVANLKERRRKFVSLCKQVFVEERIQLQGQRRNRRWGAERNRESRR